MKKQTIFLAATFLFLSSCSSNSLNRSLSQTPIKDFQDDKIAERISAVVNPQIGIKNVGAIVAIYNKGSLQFLSFGETARGNKIPPNADTLFEIGSITKTFTGLMLAQSINLKRVAATDNLSQFKTEWKDQKTASISLTELITHRSGLPRIPCNIHWSDSRQPYLDYTESDLIESLKDSSFTSDCMLNDHPTMAINYSNWGVATLGYILASKQKTSYEKLLHELVLDPLNLNDTTIKLNPDQQKRMATGYDNELNIVPPWDTKILQGQGALRSSAKDIIKYSQIYLHPESSGLENAVHLSTKPNYETPEGVAIGYAWFVKKSGSIWHNGQTGGFHSLIKIYPKRDLVVLYLSNTSRELKCIIDATEQSPCDPLKD
jgi:CubicO group peptidase (beta-lactamase class C family)